MRVDPEKLAAALESMRVRTEYTKKHVDTTQKVFGKWHAALESDKLTDLYDVLRSIADVIQFLDQNRGMFPNILTHLDQWATLLKLVDNLISDREDFDNDDWSIGHFTTDGHDYYQVMDTDRLYWYHVSTPWDITTQAHAGIINGGA